MNDIFALDPASASRISAAGAAILKLDQKDIRKLKVLVKACNKQPHWVNVLHSVPEGSDVGIFAAVIDWISIQKEAIEISTAGNEKDVPQMLFHVQENADEIRQDLPKELLGQFDSVIGDIDSMFEKASHQASKEAAREAEGHDIKTPRTSNAARPFSFSASSLQLPNLPPFESRFYCLQLAALFSSGDKIDDTVADHLTEIFEKVMTGMLPWILLCDTFRLVLGRNSLRGGGFGKFFEAVAKADAPPGTPAKIGIKIFRTDTKFDQAKLFKMVCNEIILLEKVSVSHLFPDLYSFSLDPTLPFIAQELIEGGTLTEYIDTTSLETRIEQLPSLAKRLAAAVLYMVQMHIVHRDGKPEK